MTLHGSRVHIAGSARPTADGHQLRFAHRMVKALVNSLLDLGAILIAEAGTEPCVSEKPHAPSLIFDWTVIDAVETWTDQHPCAGANSHRLSVVSTAESIGKIPPRRLRAWQNLMSKGAIHLVRVPDGWTAGAIRRQRQSLLGDVLICVSGGEGVEHLATLYRSQNKPVFAFDLNLGSSRSDKAGGGYKIYERMCGHPELFFEIKDPLSCGLLIERTRTNGGEAKIENILKALIDLLTSLTPPKVFYVRLLNKKMSEYTDVEWFFRKVVDKVVDLRELEFVQMAETEAKCPWMNAEIFNELRKAATVIVDLTGTRHNCFTEMGYAFGQGKPVLMTFREDSKIPFDTSAVEGFPWTRSSRPSQLIKRLNQYWKTRISIPPLSMPPLIL